MKKIILFNIIIFMSIFSVFGQDDLNKKVFDKKTGDSILVGYCNREGIEVGTFGEFFKNEYSVFEPYLGYLRENIKKFEGISIIIVLATWCKDSKEQVPRFLKILDSLGFKNEKITIICVDRNKKAGNVSIENLYVELVPTFIFYKNNQQLGRIIETPMESLENDIGEIISDENK